MVIYPIEKNNDSKQAKSRSGGVGGGFRRELILERVNKGKLREVGLSSEIRTAAFAKRPRCQSQYTRLVPLVQQFLETGEFRANPYVTIT